MKKLFVFLFAMMLAFGVVRPGHAFTVISPPLPSNSAHNNDIILEWNYGMSTGEGMLGINNLSLEDMTCFRWGIAGLLSLTPPPGWQWSYDQDTTMVSLMSQNDVLGTGEKITVNFLFDGTKKRQAFGSFSYYYDDTREIISIWFIAKRVPIPSAIWLLGSGLVGIVGVRRKFRNA